MDNYFEEHFDLKSLLNNEGIDWAENSKHIVLKECPNCFKRDKLFIDKKSKLWICYACVQTDQVDTYKEGRGNLWTLLLTLGFDILQVKKIFKGKKPFKYTDDFKFAKMEWNQNEDSESPKTIIPFKIPESLIELDRTEHQIRNFTEAYRYLWDRNVRSKWQYDHFKIRYDYYRKRIVFPAFTMQGICVGTQSRDITDRHRQKHPKCTNQDCGQRFYYYFKGESINPIYCPECDAKLEECFYPKSVNSRDFPKTELFFNEQNVNWTKPVILVEGPFDSINVQNSMAFLGKTLSDRQFQILIEKNPPEIILYLDGDKAGDFSTKSIYNQLRPFFEMKIVYSEEHEDPGMYNFHRNQVKINSACKPSEWYLRKGFMYI